MRVCVIGTGYVGLVTGACLSYLGHRVSCVDTDERKIHRLQAGDVPIYEPHLDKLLAAAELQGGIDFTTEMVPAVKESAVVFIAVGTPPLPGGEADLTYLESAARSIGSAMDSSHYRVVV